MRAKSCFAILFSLSIIAGITIGMIIKDAIYATPTPTSITLEPPSATPEINDTILFVGIDNMQSENPLLEGAWLATLCNKQDHPAGTIHIILITLYPIIPEHVTSPELAYLTKPHIPIPIDTNNFSGLQEIAAISSSNSSWAHVIIVDEYAMNLIISLINPNIPHPIPTPSPKTFIKAWDNPSGAYHQHEAILKTLCEEPDSFVYNTILEIVKLNNTHLKTNLSNESLIQLWQLVNFSPGKEVSCDLYP